MYFLKNPVFSAFQQKLEHIVNFDQFVCPGKFSVLKNKIGEEIRMKSAWLLSVGAAKRSNRKSRDVHWLRNSDSN